MAVRSQTTGLIGAIKLDVRRLHESWMELIFPRQRGAAHSVLGRWTPSTTGGWVAYRIWTVVGALAVVLLYPLVLFGFATRFYARQVNKTAASLGIVGVVALSVAAWGGLTVIAHFQFSGEGFVAVFAAGIVATMAAVAAVVFSRIGGRATTVVLAYPSAMTALFLPPVVAALFSARLGSVIFPGSTTVAIWLLNDVLVVGGIDEYLRDHYTLEGLAYVAMWFGIAVPLGWAFGLLVALAEVVRPSKD